MPKKEGKINDAIIENMLSWRRTGFHVHIGARIWPEDENALGNLAKYIIRASFSQERMLYIPAEKSADGVAKVVCTSKDGKTEQTFDALDWLARIVVHIPNKYEQLVRYSGLKQVQSNGGKFVLSVPKGMYARFYSSASFSTFRNERLSRPLTK